MDQIWVVLENGVEYNDETHYVGGEATVGKNAFYFKEEAEKEAIERLKQTLSGFQLSDFYEDTGFNRGDEITDQFMISNGAIKHESKYGSYYDSSDLYQLSWDQFIAWCEENNHPWTQYAPELVVVKPVNLVDASIL